jgi:hypothetical protein
MPIKDRSTWASGRYITDSNWSPRSTFYTFQQKTFKVWRSTNGGTNPRYREAIRNHVDATTTLVAEYGIYKSKSGSHTVTRPTAPNSANPSGVLTVWWEGDLAHFNIQSNPSPDPATSARASSKAKMNLNKQLQKTRTLMQGSVFLGELKQALSMLRRPAESLRKGFGEYLTAVRTRSRGVGKKPDRISKIAADTWLEYSFGWVPLVNDVKDGYNAYKSLSRKSETIRIGAGASAEFEFPTSYTDWLPYVGHCIVSKTIRNFQKSHCRYHGAILLRAGMDTQTVMDRFGLNIREIIPTAWELLPWSFLVDYFSNIGDLLNADNSLNSQLIYCCRGTMDEVTHQVTMAPNHSASVWASGTTGVSSSGYPAVASYIRRLATRSSVSLPSLDVSLSDLSLEVPSGFSKGANMVALLLSRANGIFPQKFKG